METVEHLAHIGLIAHQLGSAQPLRPDQVEQLRHAKVKYLQNSIEVSDGERLVGPRPSNESDVNGHFRAEDETKVSSIRTTTH
jgi:L-fuculose-phosphate aldolase